MSVYVCISSLSLGSKVQGFQQMCSFVCHGVGCVQILFCTQVKCAYSSVVSSQVVAPGATLGKMETSPYLGFQFILFWVPQTCGQGIVTEWLKCKLLKGWSILSFSCECLRRFVLILCLGAAGTWGAAFNTSGKYFSEQNVHFAGSLCQPVLELQDV